MKVYKSKGRGFSNSIISYADDFLNIAMGDTRLELEFYSNKKLQNFMTTCRNYKVELSREKNHCKNDGLVGCWWWC